MDKEDVGVFAIMVFVLIASLLGTISFFENTGSLDKVVALEKQVVSNTEYITKLEQDKKDLELKQEVARGVIQMLQQGR